MGMDLTGESNAVRLSSSPQVEDNQIGNPGQICVSEGAGFRDDIHPEALVQNIPQVCSVDGIIAYNKQLAHVLPECRRKAPG